MTLTLKKGFYHKEYICEYESCITIHSKAMANVKVLANKQTDRQTDKQTGKKLYAPKFIDAGAYQKRSSSNDVCLS